MNLAFQTQLRKLKDFHESTCSLYKKKNVSYKLAGEFFTISRSPESFQSMKKHLRGKKND